MELLVKLEIERRIYIYIYIYEREFYWGFRFFNHALGYYMCEKPTNTPIIHSVY
jgi:hypothetical protein